MAYTLGIDLDIDQVKLCLIQLDGPQKVPYVDWLIFRVPFNLGPDYYCEFGSALMETIAHFLFVKKLGPQQINRIYFVCGMPYSAFANFEEGLHYTANMFIQSLFDPERVGILRADGKPMSPREVMQVKGENASAFVGTQFYGAAYLASRLYKNALTVDVGSGATHITPVVKSRIDPQGRKLPKYLRHRLTEQQLLYKGTLYTSVNQLSAGVSMKDGLYPFTPRVCRMAIVASLLKYVHPEIAREHDFPLLEEKDARILIARAIGMDTKSLLPKEIDQIAQNIYEQLSDQVGEAFLKVLKAQGRMGSQMQLVTSGIGGKHLMETAFRRDQGLRERLIHLADKLPHRLHEVSSAYGMALYAMDRLMDASLAPDRIEVLP
ncbi:MAG: hypothetical protein IGS03_03325 [Candidatus Sericytochromatia bacterium]|nr:hypothetical protein [Candidatus Sericytochromatia bacterium]